MEFLLASCDIPTLCRSEKNFSFSLLLMISFQFLGLCEIDGNFFMVCEFLEKGSLLDTIKNDKATLTFEKLMKMCSTFFTFLFPFHSRVVRALDACKGMVFLEGMQVVHRDLSCRNLLVLSSAFCSFFFS